MSHNNWGIPLPGSPQAPDPKLSLPYVFPSSYPQALPYQFTPPIPMNPPTTTPQSHRSRKEKLICRSIVAADGVSAETGAEFVNQNIITLSSAMDGNGDGDLKPLKSKLNMKSHSPRTPGIPKGIRRPRPAGSDTSPLPPPRKQIKTIPPFAKNPPIPSFRLVHPSTSNNHITPPRFSIPSNHTISLLHPRFIAPNLAPTTNGNGLIDPAHNNTGLKIRVPRVFKHPRVKKEKPEKPPKIKKEKVEKPPKEKKLKIPKVPKTPRTPKTPRVPKTPRTPKTPKEKKEKIPKTPKTPKQPKTPKTPRTPKDPNAPPKTPRKPKADKPPRTPKTPKTPRLTKKKKLLHEYFLKYAEQYQIVNGPQSEEQLERLRQRIMNPKKSTDSPPKRRLRAVKHENLEHDVRDETDDEDDEVKPPVTNMPRKPPLNNTHLLLSPMNLKKMLKGPSPAPSSFNEDEQDEELMLTSNSLFRDLSLNRQFKTPSPSSDSTISGSPSSRTSLASVSPTTGRQRYSRRRFGRLFPPFEINHCAFAQDECRERPLTGSQYCGLHMEPGSSALHSQCSYTCPSSLKRCEQFTVGDDEREIRFCDAHATRIATTRLKNLRVPPATKSMDDLLKELKKNLETTDADDDEDEVPEQDSNGDFKEELSPEFNVDLPMPLLQRGKNLRQMAQFQMDADTDEDLLDGDDTNLLQHAGYYSTDEVVSIYRSKLQKLRSMYIGHMGVLKNYYQEYYERFLADQRRNQTRKVSYTSNPRLLNEANFKVQDEFYKRQHEENDKLNSLLKYRHEKGRAAVIQELAREQFEELKAKEAAQKLNSKNPQTGETDEEVEVELDSDEDEDEHSPYDYLFKMEDEDEAKGSASMPGSPGSIPSVGSAPLDEAEASVPAALEIPEEECCTFEDPEKNPSRCTESVIPCSKFCMDHIMHDPKQSLFALCNRAVENDESKCQVPILSVIDKLGCSLHRWPQLKSFTELKTERKKRLELQASFSTATGDEEEEILADLVAQEAVSVEDFDSAVDYILSKGFDAPDTDDSSDDDSEDDNEAPKSNTSSPVSQEPSSSSASVPKKE